LQSKAALPLLATACLLVLQAWSFAVWAGQKSHARASQNHASGASAKKQGRHRYSSDVSSHSAATSSRKEKSRRSRASTKALSKSKANTASRQGAKQSGKVSDQDSGEPKAMPPNYEAETRLLAKAYQLRDQALNEQMRGDLGDAVKHLSEATEISNEYYQGEPNPAESQLYFELAVAAEAAGQNILADKSYGESIKRNPKATEPRLRSATLTAKLGNLEKAIAEARLASGADQADPRPHNLLSLLLEHKGDFEEAATERARAKALLFAKPVPKPEPCRVKAAEPIQPTEPADSVEKSEEEQPKEGDNQAPDQPRGLP
jgi:Flp pilus assembly protein TadD